MGLYLDQLTTAGIETHVETLDHVPAADGGSPGNTAFSIRLHRKFCNQFAHYERLILSDAWDVTFYGSHEDVIRKIPMDHCLLGAAKEYYPEQGRRHLIVQGGTLWNHANGGLLSGTPENILKLADTMERHPLYSPTMANQGMHNILLEDEVYARDLDRTTTLFFCLFDGYPELDFENGLPVNTLCKTAPSFIHANGHWPTDEMYAKRERSLAKETT
jgi:hypothetical protein